MSAGAYPKTTLVINSVFVELDQLIEHAGDINDSAVAHQVCGDHNFLRQNFFAKCSYTHIEFLREISREGRRDATRTRAQIGPLGQAVSSSC